MSETILANYDVLSTVAQKFAALHDQAAAMEKTLHNTHAELESTWTGAGFDQYSQEAMNVTLPATKRLVAAMQTASEVAKQVSNIFDAADEECQGGFHIQI